MPVRNYFIIAPICALACACASIPDVTVSYYFPKAETQLVVTQSIGCSEKIANQHRSIRSVISVSPTTVNSADVNWLDGTNQPHKGHLRYKDLSGTFSDGDATVTLTADGRLSGINATSAGAGDTIVKNLVTVAGAALATFGAVPHGPFVASVEDRACDEVDKFAVITQAAGAAAAKPAPSVVTLTFSVAVLYDIAPDGSPAFVIDQVLSQGYGALNSRQTSIQLVPDALSQPAYDSLNAILGTRTLITLKMQSDAAHVRYLDTTLPPSVAAGAGVAIDLSRVAILNLAISGHVADLKQETQIWSAFVPAPSHTIYQLPIPKPALFGKTAFGLALSDYGSITSLHYGSSSGAQDASDAFGAVAKAMQSKSAEDRAIDVKGQADLIAQQQRLIACQLAPTQCK